MIEQLEQIAREKVKTLRFVDEIEVYLAYPVKLKERLDLQIDVKDMLYFGCSGVTEARPRQCSCNHRGHATRRLMLGQTYWRKDRTGSMLLSSITAL
jgi:hypothetical protein